MASLTNVREDIRKRISRFPIACEVANSFLDIFTIEDVRSYTAHKWRHTILSCKPTKTTAQTLLVNREVLVMITNVNDLQVRTLHTARELISASNGRLEPDLYFVVHADPNGDEKLRAWGREQGYKVIPIYRRGKGKIPDGSVLKSQLSEDLFAYDPFAITGPVLADADFFGRKANATDTLRHLEHGGIISFFGIRKIGKTSLINRVAGLARGTRSLNFAMIDCSVEAFYQLDAKHALRAVAKVAKMAATRGYAHITEALKATDEEILPVFDDLWTKYSHEKPLALVFDEVDYITPASPTNGRWKQNFNKFWREFRAVYQEAQRMGFRLSVLVSGVSSQAFKAESFDGVENAVLHFIPETYLSPFARQASTQMIRDLAKRCGLSFTTEDRDHIAEVCGDFPYWIRLAGSFLHRELDVASRPIEVDSAVVDHLLREFVQGEGVDVSRVALEDLNRKFPEPIELLNLASKTPMMPLSEGKLLLRYGLVARVPSGVSLQSDMLRAGLDAMREEPDTASSDDEPSAHPLELNASEWAEELALINRRRNILERKLRELIRIMLKMGAKEGESWVRTVLTSLPGNQRAQLEPLSGDALLTKLYWKDIGIVIGKSWASFERVLGDKARFKTAVDTLNDRPDAHAKPTDEADLALYRRELAWLEDRLA